MADVRQEVIEKIRDEIEGFPIGHGTYESNRIGISEAQELAEMIYDNVLVQYEDEGVE